MLRPPNGAPKARLRHCDRRLKYINSAGARKTGARMPLLRVACAPGAAANLSSAPQSDRYFPGPPGAEAAIACALYLYRKYSPPRLFNRAAIPTALNTSGRADCHGVDFKCVSSDIPFYKSFCNLKGPRSERSPAYSPRSETTRSLRSQEIGRHGAHIH